jgi:hypothetical protein
MKYFIFLLLILSLNLNAQNSDYKIINANVFITYIDKELHSDLTSYLIKELHNTQNNSQFLLTKTIMG